MNAPAGWYPDPADPHITRYWDGDRYTRELRWNGTAWVDPAAAAPPPPVVTPTPVPQPVEPTPVAHAVEPTPVTPTPVEPTPAVTPDGVPTPVAFAPSEAMPTAPAMPAPTYASMPAAGTVPAAPTGAGRPNPTPTFWIFMAASAGVALSALLPWVSVSGFGGTISSEPGTGGPGVLIVFAVAVAAIAWPTISSPALSKARKIGLLPIVGFLAIAVVTNWSDLADLKDKYNGAGGFGLSIDAGIGFYLYTVCVIALVVAVVRVWLAGGRATAPA